jgi:dUTP pyrophosphatase
MTEGTLSMDSFSQLMQMDPNSDVVQSLMEMIENKVERGELSMEALKDPREMLKLLPVIIELAQSNPEVQRLQRQLLVEVTDLVMASCPEIKFVKTHEDAQLPTNLRPNPVTGDTGYDLIGVEDIYVPARGSTIAPVGLKLASISPGFWFRIEPRSGLGFKKNIQPHLGVIDNPYQGDLAVKLYNFGDDDVTIPKGTGVAQIVVYKLQAAQLKFVKEDEVIESDRGEKGFGSSDTKE